jgi:nucleoid DNA-binding protein
MVKLKDIIQDGAGGYLNGKQSAELADKILSRIQSEILLDGFFKLQGVGYFYTQTREPECRNPKTNKIYQVPKRYYVKFRASKPFEAIINRNS